ncbi:DUF7331 family protein [Halorientalis pallida]
MQQRENQGRFVEEEAPDGTVVIYDSQNTRAWLQSDAPVDLGRQT